VSARRLFVALPLPATAKAELNSLVHVLRRGAPGIRWVRPEHLHITLRFLGDVEEEQSVALVESLNQVTELPPFTFNLAGLGAFPDRRRPRVVWTGIDSGREQMMSLAACVEKSVLAAGLPPEDRPFSPHLTLGRVKEPGDLTALWQEASAASATSFVGKPVHASDVRLIWSTLTPTGPVYRDVESFPLRGKENQS
jgi:2'-5' RNA ligase